jgi:DHA1 family multidrug resistance protein-like MFS transporter
LNQPPIDLRRAHLALYGLVAASFADALGATMVLPVLPLFLRQEGASFTEIGLVAAAFWAAGLLVGYPMGRLSDRLGRKRLIVGSQVVYALATAAFALTPSPLWFLILRALQGAAAGATNVLAMAAVADVVVPERRGRAYGSLTGANMAGTIVGPLIGSTLFAISVGLTFLASAAVALIVAAIIAATLPNKSLSTAHSASVRLGSAIWRNRAILGILVSSAALGLLIGMYDTVWSLLMHARHASDFEIGLSFTLFGLPFAVGSWPAGWLADRLDNRWLIAVSLVAGAGFAIAYPFIPSPGWLIALGVFEGIFTVTGAPARLAMLSRQVRPEVMGQMQGIYGSFQVGGAAVAAGFAGALFGAGIPLPFVATAAVMLLAAVCLWPLWRGVEGRPHRSGASVAPEG